MAHPWSRQSGRLGCLFPAALGLALLLGPALADMSGRPLLAEDIERRLDGFFIFATDGRGTYDIFQHLETGKGLSASDEVVCMMRACFIAVARVPAAALDRRRNLEVVRQHFRDARKAYEALQRAVGTDVVSMAAAWREAGRRLQACLDRDEAC